MSENTKLWDILGRTDPAHTKGFTRGGGFRGTAIKPMWSYRRMTEEFGPCGEGWGVNAPSFQVVPGSDGEVLVYCTASVWYTFAAGERQRVVYGVGGDKVVNKFSSGLKSDDEAFKKAFTDAVTNALKLIGVGADVHMGMFDDNKYVNTMRQEFAEEPTRAPADMPPTAPPPPDDTYAPPPRRKSGLPETGWREDGSRTSYSLKKSGSWEKLMFKISAALGDCHTRVSLDKLRTEIWQDAHAEKWNREFFKALKEEFDQHYARVDAEQERHFHAETDAAILDQRMREERARADPRVVGKMMDNFDVGEAKRREERAALASHPVNGG